MTFSPTRTSFVALCAAAAILFSGTVQAAPKVVASIKPLHALVAGVMGETGTPHLIVRGAASPHAAALKPSDARALDSADLVFWMGEGLENFLEKPLEALASKASIHAMGELDGMKKLANREDGHDDHGHDKHKDHAEHKEHGHKDEKHGHKDEKHAKHEKHGDHGHKEKKHGHKEEKHADHGHHDHDHGAFDMHMWLDPENARVMVAHIARVLTKTDPANAAQYEKNAKALNERISQLDAKIKDMLAPMQDKRFVVFHDAYQYFEERYDLRTPAAVSLNPEVPPGGRRLKEIRHTIKDNGAECIFSEPQFTPAHVRVIAEGTNVRTGVLDPLGADLKPGADLYFGVLEGLATSLKTCLGKAGQ